MSPAQSSIAVVLLRVAGVASQAFMFAWLANLLDIAGMGLFSAIYVFWGLVRMLGPMGLDQIAMREIACARAAGNTGLGSAISTYACRDMLRVSLILSLLTALVLTSLWMRGSDGLTLGSIAVVAAAVPAFVLTGLSTALTRAFDRNIASQAIETFGFQLLALVGLGIQWLLGSVTLGSVLALNAACAWLAAIAGIVILRQASPRSDEALPTEDKRRLRREAAEVWQALLLIGMANRAPTFIALYVLGPVATAILEVAMRFGTLPLIFTSAVSTTFGPTMAHHHARKDKAGLADAVSAASWLAFLPAAATLLVAIVFGRTLLGAFFPPVYASAYLPLVIIITAMNLHGMFSQSSTLLTMTGYQRTVRLFAFLQLAAVVVSSFILGLTIGVEGIALAILIGSFAFDCGLASRIRGLLGIPGTLRPSGLMVLVNALKPASWRLRSEGAQ